MRDKGKLFFSFFIFLFLSGCEGKAYSNKRDKLINYKIPVSKFRSEIDIDPTYKSSTTGESVIEVFSPKPIFKASPVFKHKSTTESYVHPKGEIEEIEGQALFLVKNATNKYKENSFVKYNNKKKRKSIEQISPNKIPDLPEPEATDSQSDEEEDRSGTDSDESKEFGYDIDTFETDDDEVEDKHRETKGMEKSDLDRPLKERGEHILNAEFAGISHFSHTKLPNLANKKKVITISKKGKKQLKKLKKLKKPKKDLKSEYDMGLDDMGNDQALDDAQHDHHSEYELGYLSPWNIKRFLILKKIFKLSIILIPLLMSIVIIPIVIPVLLIIRFLLPPPKINVYVPNENVYSSGGYESASVNIPEAESPFNYSPPRNLASSNQYGAPPLNVANNYGAPPLNNVANNYGAPPLNNVANNYGAPPLNNVANNYGAPPLGNQNQYGAPPQLANQYGPPFSNNKAPLANQEGYPSPAGGYDADGYDGLAKNPRFENTGGGGGTHYNKNMATANMAAAAAAAEPLSNMDTAASFGNPTKVNLRIPGSNSNVTPSKSKTPKGIKDILELDNGNDGEDAGNVGAESGLYDMTTNYRPPFRNIRIRDGKTMVTSSRIQRENKPSNDYSSAITPRDTREDFKFNFTPLKLGAPFNKNVDTKQNSKFWDGRHVNQRQDYAGKDEYDMYADESRLDSKIVSVVKAPPEIIKIYTEIPKEIQYNSEEDKKSKHVKKDLNPKNPKQKENIKMSPKDETEQLKEKLVENTKRLIEETRKEIVKEILAEKEKEAQDTQVEVHSISNIMPLKMSSVVSKVAGKIFNSFNINPTKKSKPAILNEKDKLKTSPVYIMKKHEDKVNGTVKTTWKEGAEKNETKQFEDTYYIYSTPVTTVVKEKEPEKTKKNAKKGNLDRFILSSEDCMERVQCELALIRRRKIRESTEQKVTRVSKWFNNSVDRLGQSDKARNEKIEQKILDKPTTCEKFKCSRLSSLRRIFKWY